VVNPFAEETSGNDEVLVRLIREFDQSLFRFFIVQPGDNPYAPIYRKLGAEVIFMKMSIIKRNLSPGFIMSYFADFWPTVGRIMKVCRRNAIELVHTNTTQILGAGLAAKILGIPSIYHVHSYSISRPEWVIRSLNYWFMATGDRMLANSPVTADIFLSRGFRPDKMKVVWNPVDFEAFASDSEFKDMRSELGIDQYAPLVAIVGRVARIKCIENFIRASKTVLESVPDAAFLVVGGAQTDEDKAYQKELVFLTQELGLQERVRFLGRRSDIPRIMKSINLLVHTSESEGFGLVVAEAMAAGVPVVAAATGAIPYLVDDGITGRLVPFGKPEDMASAIVSLLRDPEKAEKMGESGRLKAEKLWKAANVAEAITEVYLDLLDSRKSKKKRERRGGHQW